MIVNLNLKKPFGKLLFLISFTTITLSACAQSHQQNQDFLKQVEKIATSTVLLNNSSNTIPVADLEKRKIASVRLGYKYQIGFDSLLNKYAQVTPVDGNSYAQETTLNGLEDNLKYYNTVILALPENLVGNSKYIDFINHLAQRKQLIVTLFAQGNKLPAFDSLTSPLIFCPDTSANAATTVAQMIFGGISFTELLSQNYSPKYTRGSGFKTQTTRLKYTVPEDAGVNTQALAGIDAIMAEAITARAFPGGVVMAIKDGKVIWNKAYGFRTYNKLTADQVNDIFDIASVSKVTATTPVVMQLTETGKLNLDTTVGYYIAKARTAPMNPVKVREVMLHQAGFIPYIPFQDDVKPADHSPDSSALYNTKVADGYYIRRGYFNDVMWPRMINSPLRTRGKYVYSDISMYVMQDIVERVTETPLDNYVQRLFYKPLGMQTAGFLPRNRFAKEKIVPTEQDSYFRKTLLQGYVHDQGAALKGGVAGHAGVFASANDLAIYYQMLLNRGTYGGKTYFKPETVDLFTSKQSNVSRRGLGFDRWDPDLTKKYPSAFASSQTYGHTGYTGTAAWVDPARGLVYIFLSNRVNPQVSEQINKLGIRRRIQDVINSAIDDAKK